MKHEIVDDADAAPVRKKSSRKSWMSSEYVASQRRFVSAVAMSASSVVSLMLYRTIKSISSFRNLSVLTRSASSRKIE